MSIVINTPPDLKYRPVWLTGEIDFDVNLTLDQLKEQDGEGWQTGGATRQFEAEFQWAVNEFIARMEQKGHIYIGLPDMIKAQAKHKGYEVYRDSVVVIGPIYALDFTSPLPLGPDGEELPRPMPRSLEDSGGRVSYRLGAFFAQKEHVLRRLVERDRDPAAYEAARNARKVGGVWLPHTPPSKQHFEMRGSFRDN